ncbi:MAG: phenylalanine--tRNA ligase subunit beta [Alphaproteobacteria bacterium]|nr:phenylalanine--tRNA ligase subunit beta [Alphaproteobacteria bacterium]
MKLNQNWLYNYLPLKLNTTELSDILTQIGLEVEEIYEFDFYKGGFKNVIVAEVISITNHPNQNHLKVVKLNIGTKQIAQVVCGSPTIAMHQLVAFAQPGAILFNYKQEEILIEGKLINGVDSLGMICSEFELGISDFKADILKLSPQNAKPGQELASIYVPRQDTILNLNITANRSDALSYIGIATELAAFLNHNGHLYQLQNIYHSKLNLIPEIKNFKIIVEHQTDCPRYVGMRIDRVKVHPSPEWLKAKLLSVGVNPINNIVDITNYILLETGQPLHAFDADKIHGDSIFVKRFPEGFIFKTLDGVDRQLKETDIMIADCNGPLCMAGVYGGIDSGITVNTTSIFIESACFNPINIRQTSFAHQLRTEAAQRFEKKIDISNCKKALQRACQLIVELAGGDCSLIEDLYPNPAPQKEITLKYAFFKKIAGFDLNPEKIKSILAALNFEIIVNNFEFIHVRVPFAKTDVEFPADLVEEILRIYGFNAIPTVNKDLKFSLSNLPEHKIEKNIYQKISNYLVGEGFFEIWTNSLISAEHLAPFQKENAIFLENSLSNEHNVLRTSLLESGLAVIEYNLRRQQHHLKLFEFGQIYNKSSNQYNQEKHLALFITGNQFERHWKTTNNAVDIFDLKGYVQGIISILKIPNIFLDYSAETGAVNIFSNQTVIGEIKILTQSDLKHFLIKQPVFYAFLYVKKLVELSHFSHLTFQKIPRFPAIERDLSLIINKNCFYEKIHEIINKIKPELLKNFSVFDLFENNKIGIDKKAIGLNFMFQHDERTLKDSEIDDIMKSIQNYLIRNLPAEIRI